MLLTLESDAGSASYARYLLQVLELLWIVEMAIYDYGMSS